MKTQPQKTKILFLIQLPPPIHGVSVINNHIYNLGILDNLVNKQVLQLKFSQTLTKLSKFSFSKIIRTLSIFFNLIFNCILFKPKFIYFTIAPANNTFYRDLIFVFVIKLFKAIPIYHLHGKGISGNIKHRPWLAKIYKWVFEKSIIIHLSEGLLKKEILALNLKKCDTYVLNNGIEKHMNLNSVSILDKPHDVLFLSNLFPSKGIFVLLEALKLVKNEHSNIKANIVGDTINEEILYKVNLLIEKYDLTNNVIIHGRKYNHDKFCFFQESKIFVHPTLNDAFPLVIIEALQFGLPVISTFEGAIPEIINTKTGVLVERNNPNVLAQAIIDLLTNEEKLTKMSLECKELYNRKFTIEIFEKNIKNIFLKILE